MNYRVRNTTYDVRYLKKILIIFVNVAVDAEEETNDGNPDFQESKTEEEKSEAERKSEKHYHFNNCTFNFKEPQ